MNKPKRPCGHAGCRVITDNRYCPDHEHLVKQQRRDRNNRYDKHQRDQQSDRFYHSIEWDRVRQEALIRDRGLCQQCLIDKLITMADMVHHRFPIKTHWHFRLLLSNLISLCNSCHAKIDHKKIGGRVMVSEQSWKEFRDVGLLWWVNMILHTFGWAIVYVFEGEEIKCVYPARVKFRGFREKDNTDGYQKVSKYMSDNASELEKESNQ